MNVVKQNTQIFWISQINTAKRIVPYDVRRKIQTGRLIRHKKSDRDIIATGRANNSTTSHRALAPVLILAQYFAVMPIYGIGSESARGLRFTWFNLRVLHTVVILCGFMLIITLSTIWAVSSQLSISIIEPLIWFISKFIVMVNFVSLAKRWPHLMMHWEDVERKLPTYSNPKRNAFFCKEIKFYTIFITVMLFAEHTMSIAAGVFRGVICTSQANLEGYFLQAWPQLYYVATYDGGWKAFFMELMNYYCNFLWSFMDIFIIAISICLSTRLRQLNGHLERHKGMIMCNEFWAVQRGHYSAISGLVVKVDDAITMITAFSLSNNLYYILIQLLHSFQPQGTILENIYFWFSLVFLVGRTVVMSLFAARIHDESKKPAVFIRAIPNENYDIEAQRFLEEVNNNTVALTGMRFFYLTRSLILSVAGTIITFELVLVQFQIFSSDTVKELCTNYVRSNE